MTVPARQVLSIDLGDLRSRVEARAASEGSRPGPWIRKQLEQLLGVTEQSACVQEPQESSRRIDGELVKFTARLTPTASLMLAQQASKAGLSQAELVSRLIIGDNPAVVDTRAWAAALTYSNHQLLVLSRSLSQVVDSVRQAGGLTPSEADQIVAISRGVREHLALASKQLAELKDTRRSRAAQVRSAASPGRTPRRSANSAEA